jgi:hypothetical protein
LHYVAKKQVKVVVVSKEPFSKEAWIVLKMERVFNILVFFADVLSCK